MFQQKLERVGKNERELARELTLYESEDDNRRNAEKQEVADAFAVLQNTITDAQRQVIDKYWGISNIKTREELNVLLSR